MDPISLLNRNNVNVLISVAKRNAVKRSLNQTRYCKMNIMLGIVCSLTNRSLTKTILLQVLGHSMINCDYQVFQFITSTLFKQGRWSFLGLTIKSHLVAKFVCKVPACKPVCKIRYVRFSLINKNDWLIAVVTFSGDLVDRFS